jgi:hypothetical protein
MIAIAPHLPYHAYFQQITITSPLVFQPQIVPHPPKHPKFTPHFPILAKNTLFLRTAFKAGIRDQGLGISNGVGEPYFPALTLPPCSLTSAFPIPVP